MGQLNSSFSISNSSLATTSNNMPFWMWANNDGKILKDNSFLNVTELNIVGNYFFKDSNSFIRTGTVLIGGIGNGDSYFQHNELYAGINISNWELNAGLFHNQLQFGGLSTSNGNMARSRNARPYPRIGIGLATFKPTPFFRKWLSVKGEYEEGLLTDERYVDNTHLHHKSFYLKIQPTANFDIQAGMEHYAMWGGTSRNKQIGRLPNDVSAYIKYITGSSGDDDFLETDQLNVAGNSYGTYQFLVTQQFGGFETSLNISHPFEDFSGINLRNWPDNIIGLYFKLEKPEKLITHFLYEFTNTRQQGIIDSIYRYNEVENVWKSVHEDNYYNHGVYRSGVTNHQQTMGSPLFFPVKIDEGISMGIESTRFFAHHIGARGKLFKSFAWKGMLTFMRHLGSYRLPYVQPLDQTSFSFNLNYSGNLVPFIVELTIAKDVSDVHENILGMGFAILYVFD